MTEASLGEFYESRLYRRDDIEILHIGNAQPNETGSCSLYAVMDLGGVVTLTFTFDEFTQLGVSAGGHLVVAKSGVNNTPSTWEPCLPINLAPSKPVTTTFVAECKALTVAANWIGFSAEIGDDGIVHIWQLEEWTSFAVQPYGPHHDIQPWTEFVKIPSFTIVYPTR